MASLLTINSNMFYNTRPDMNMADTRVPLTCACYVHKCEGERNCVSGESGSHPTHLDETDRVVPTDIPENKSGVNQIESHRHKSYTRKTLGIKHTTCDKHLDRPKASEASSEGSSLDHRTCNGCSVDSEAAPNCSKRRLLTDLPFNLFQVLKVALLLIVMDPLTVQGQGLGPLYKIRRICVSDDECNTDIGEVCWWEWDGCDTGQCRCDPRTSFYDSTLNYCRPLKYGDERCEAGDRCRGTMDCLDGYCQCKLGIMTSDKMFCLRDYERFLGQKCTRHSDICYQRNANGYARKDTHCSHDGRCKCNRGYKEDGYACRKWNVNEPGCHKDHHCQGGALCIDSRCQCPSRYEAVARNSKCARLGAKFDLQLGEVCDEDSERGYCAYGLVCHRCPSEVVHKCVRFMEAEALPYYYSSSSHLQASLLVTMATVFTINVLCR